jgi:hypothetical protein
VQAGRGTGEATGLNHGEKAAQQHGIEHTATYHETH